MVVCLTWNIFFGDKKNKQTMPKAQFTRNK